MNRARGADSSAAVTAFVARVLQHTLGAGSASKSTAMYSIKYMGKDSVNISAAATVLHEADKKVREYPSSADDKLTAERTSKHFCQHVINHRCGWHLLRHQICGTAV